MAKPLSRDEAEKTIAAVEQAKQHIRYDGGAGQNYGPNGYLTIAAKALGVDASTVWDRIKAGGGIERAMVNWGTPLPDLSAIAPIAPQPDQFTSYEGIHGKHDKLRIRVKAGSDTMPPEGPIYTILAIGDHHDKPGRDKTRATWIGRLAADKRPDYIVSIGDWASLDSLSMFEAPGSARHAAMTTYPEDLESLEESLAAFHKGLPIGEIPIYQTHGNHEFRAWRAGNADPKRCSDFPLRLEQTFARFRWQTVEFGQFLTLGGVDWVHIPLNIMGRELGGQDVERSIGNKALRSIVFGHTHRRGMYNAVKVGQNRKITALNLGTSMPWGMTETYNRVSQTGWSYGIFLLRVQNGAILSEKFFDMLEIEKLYGG